jgi:hypothetical protein
MVKNAHCEKARVYQCKRGYGIQLSNEYPFAASIDCSSQSWSVQELKERRPSLRPGSSSFFRIFLGDLCAFKGPRAHTMSPPLWGCRVVKGITPRRRYLPNRSRSPSKPSTRLAAGTAAVSASGRNYRDSTSRSAAGLGVAGSNLYVCRLGVTQTGLDFGHSIEDGPDVGRGHGVLHHVGHGQDVTPLAPADFVAA